MTKVELINGPVKVTSATSNRTAIKNWIVVIGEVIYAPINSKDPNAGLAVWGTYEELPQKKEVSLEDMMKAYAEKHSISPDLLVLKGSIVLDVEEEVILNTEVNEVTN